MRWVAPETSYDGDDWGNDYEEVDSANESVKDSPNVTQNQLEAIEEDDDYISDAESKKSQIEKEIAPSEPIYNGSETSLKAADDNKVAQHSSTNTDPSSYSDPKSETERSSNTSVNINPGNTKSLSSEDIDNEVIPQPNNSETVLENAKTPLYSSVIEPEEEDTSIQDIYGFYENRNSQQYTQGNYSTSPYATDVRSTPEGRPFSFQLQPEPGARKQVASSGNELGKITEEASSSNTYPPIEHLSVGSHSRNTSQISDINSITTRESEHSVQDVTRIGLSEPAVAPRKVELSNPYISGTDDSGLQDEVRDDQYASLDSGSGDHSYNPYNSADGASDSQNLNPYQFQELNNQNHNGYVDNDNENEYANANNDDSNGVSDESESVHSQMSFEDNYTAQNDNREQETSVVDPEIAELYQGSSKFLKRPMSTYNTEPIPEAISDQTIKNMLTPKLDESDHEYDATHEHTGHSNDGYVDYNVHSDNDTSSSISSRDSVSLDNETNATSFVLPSEKLKAKGTSPLERISTNDSVSDAESRAESHVTEINRESVTSSVLSTTQAESDTHFSDINEQFDSLDNEDVSNSLTLRTISPSSSLHKEVSPPASSGDTNASSTPTTSQAIPKKVNRPPHINLSALFNAPGSSNASRTEQMRLLRKRESDYSTGLNTWITAIYPQINSKMVVYSNGIPPEAAGLDLDTAAKISNAVHTSTTNTKEKLINVGEKSKSLGTKSKSFFAKVIR